MHCQTHRRPYRDPLPRTRLLLTAPAVAQAIAPLLSPLPARSEDYCVAGADSCRVTTEVLVDQPVARRLEVPLPSVLVDVGGQLDWTDPEGWFSASCNGAAACRAELVHANVTVEDQCAGAGSTWGPGASAFSINGERPAYTCESDCATAGNVDSRGDTWAARTAFYWVEQAIRKARFYIDPQAVPFVRLETNHSAATHSGGAHLVCAGFWDSSTATIDLFQSGGGCGNTGENGSIVVHEWGHALYEALYDPNAPRPIDETTHEAQADVHAALVTGDACIGRGIRPGERCQGCRASCNGLRDLGAFSLQSANPAVAATLFDRDGLDCPAGSGPLGAAPHCESLIASSAFMDLVALLRIRHGETLGVAVAEALYYGSLPFLTSAYQVVGGATSGCHDGSWYKALLEADDRLSITAELRGDGDPNNGTPNGCLVFQAFDAHGIACQTPLDCPSWVSAGPDKEACVGTPVTLGQPQPPLRVISWSHGEGGSPVTVVPSAAGLVTYRMEAWDLASRAASDDRVDERAYDCPHSFDDDFDVAPDPSWETTGLWRHVSAADRCPYPSSPAMYFGLDVCHYETCRSSHGDLTSGVLAVPADLPAGFVPALSFTSRRAVESHEDPVTTDRTEVWIEEWPQTPSSKVDLRWARSSASALPTCMPGADPPLDCPPQGPPLQPWQGETVLPISLQRYAGRTVRVRFHFDSLDARYNDLTGWLVDDVRVAPVAATAIPAGPLPTLTLVSPADGETLPCCECATFEIAAFDSFGNDISDQVVWYSDINGKLGSGRGIRMVLSPTLPAGGASSPGDPRKPHHLVTASVVDRAGQSNWIQFRLRVPDNGQECRLLSLTPAELRRNCALEGDR